MNENVVEELKNTIKKLKAEILQKQSELISLLEQYQKLTGIELDEIDGETE